MTDSDILDEIKRLSALDRIRITAHAQDRMDWTTEVQPMTT